MESPRIPPLSSSQPLEGVEQRGELEVLSDSELPSDMEGSSDEIEDVDVRSADLTPYEETASEKDLSLIEHFQGFLHSMRRQIPEMRREHVDFVHVQEFVTQVVQGQLSAVARIAQQNLATRGMECPVGDNWSMIGLGSLGRGDVNPYSDLDFAVLVKENNRDTREYFKALVTEMAEIVGQLRDEGMVICTGNVAPPYEVQVAGEELERGSEELLSTPEQMATKCIDLILDSSRPSTGLNAYSLFQVSHVQGDAELANTYLSRISTCLSKRLPSAKALEHFPSDKKKQRKKRTYGNAIGKTLLREGIQFWPERKLVSRLALRSAPDDWSVMPFFDIKKGILRPIQNSVLGMSIYHGIHEPNILKAIDKLVAKRHMDKGMGKKLKEAYKSVNEIRTRSELEAQKEQTIVTRYPEHMRFKYVHAVKITKEEHRNLLEVKSLLDKLKNIVQQYY